MEGDKKVMTRERIRKQTEENNDMEYHTENWQIYSI